MRCLAIRYFAFQLLLADVTYVSVGFPTLEPVHPSRAKA